MTKDEALQEAERAALLAVRMADTAMLGAAQLQATLAVAYATMALALPESARRPPSKEWMND